MNKKKKNYHQATGLHTIPRLKEHVKMHLNSVHLTPEEWQRVMHMEILLHIHDKLEHIERILERE